MYFLKYQVDIKLLCKIIKTNFITNKFIILCLYIYQGIESMKKFILINTYKKKH